MFSKNLRAVYLYVVCFITLMMVIGGIIATVAAIANYAFPPGWGDDITRLRTLINSIAWWAIAAPIFAFHWWQARKLTNTAENEEAAE